MNSDKCKRRVCYLRPYWIAVFICFVAVKVSAAELLPTKAAWKPNTALSKPIDHFISEGLKESLATYPDNVLIQPVLGQFRYMHGKRWAFGILTGTSYVNLTVQIYVGERMVEKELYRAVGAWRGTISVGGADKKMLQTIANDAVEYVKTKPWEAIPPIEDRGSSPAPDENEDRYDTLIKLGELREKGLLTEEEFEAEKAKLLDSNPPEVDDIPRTEK